MTKKPVLVEEDTHTALWNLKVNNKLKSLEEAIKELFRIKEEYDRILAGLN